MTTISTFIERILLTVSIKDSPFLTDEFEAEKLITSAESRFCASSNDSFVLVLFSKNKLAIVTSLREGTFLIGRLITSLKCEEVSKMSSISASVRYLIPNKCETLNLLICLIYDIYFIFSLLLLPMHKDFLISNGINLPTQIVGLYG